MSPLDQLIACYESITPERIGALAACYSADAYFKDPFNEVTGQAAIAKIFSHMFSQVEAPSFRVQERFESAAGAMLVWEFRFGPQRAQRCIRGSTHLRFDAAGKVSYHRDYWDPAEELYARVPLLGGLMRLLKRALQA